ncbi:GCN5-related N-acetyltransferase [Methylobacterium sp. 4-46]|uniref:GNAT family N-acetyltransferase n=1 Tax=Methylobacterium sp. (strain 4-46) TaxID=426117 RepID=UPI000165C566|nr:GNAT family N-acetyltransferase [Methylobacterium sp. 4-46]ACA18617.1 GCN5-related N-acetyltransferase [Methylobacterium sp. 4-46]
MTGDSTAIRRATRDELELAVEWAAQEAWNPGLADADCFYAADPGGFLIAYVGTDPVACISLVRYGATFAFLGFYIVRPERRGRGYGYQIWQAAMERAGDRTVGLDGVVAQQDNYRKSGFVLAHRNVRFGGRPRCQRPDDPRLTSIGSELLQYVIQYDRAFFPGERGTFLRCWFRPDRRTGMALVEDGSVTGYGVVRACREGFKIGPLFADAPHGADLLFRALVAQVQGAPIFLDGPEPNGQALDLAARHGLSPVFETARMYRGSAPDLPLSRIYGITTFELG